MINITKCHISRKSHVWRLSRPRSFRQGETPLPAMVSQRVRAASCLPLAPDCHRMSRSRGAPEGIAERTYVVARHHGVENLCMNRVLGPEEAC